MNQVCHNRAIEHFRDLEHLICCHVENQIEMEKMETHSMIMEVCKQLAKGKEERPKRKWGLGVSCKWNFLYISLATEQVYLLHESLKQRYYEPGIDVKLRSTNREKVQDTHKKKALGDLEQKFEWDVTVQKVAHAVEN